MLNCVKEYLNGNNEIRLKCMREWQKTLKHLYRYRPLNENREYEIEALKKNTIFCTSFDKLNDDEEGIIIRELLGKFPEDTRRTVKRQLIKLRKEYGVSCFTSVDPHDDKNMWSNYAGNGEGICIQYNMSDMIDKGYFILPVIYVDKVQGSYFCEKHKFFGELSYIMKHKQGKDKEKTFRNWESEKEWRHIEKITDIDEIEKNIEKRGQYSKIQLEPEKIFLGKRLKKDYIIKLKEIFPQIEMVKL